MQLTEADRTSPQHKSTTVTMQGPAFKRDRFEVTAVLVGDQVVD